MLSAIIKGISQGLKRFQCIPLKIHIINASILYCSQYNIMDLDFNKNEDIMKQALGQLRNRFQKIAVGGGLKSAEKQHEKNKLTAPERIAYLLDNDQAFYEIRYFDGYEMYME